MPIKMKVVCPKCRAKLKFDPDKITSEVVKFKCPGCKSVLSIRKPAPSPDGSGISSKPASQPVDPNALEAGAELMKLAQAFESEMGFNAGEEDDGPEEVELAESIPEIAKEMPPEIPAESESNREKACDGRKFKRVKFKRKVLVDNQIMVEALDICENGLFLHTGRSFEDGALVEVGIPTMPGNFDLRVQARVQHNHRGIGMGLQFVGLDEKQKAQLAKLISSLDAEAQKDRENRKKILLIGGTDTARNINKSKLVLEGFYVLQATTADEVFKILKDEYPDAMVLEWQEPKFNCKGLLARIKEMPEYDAIIRVVLSALTDSTVQREIVDAGAHRYMAKMDTNPARLSLVLKQLIEERDS